MSDRDEGSAGMSAPGTAAGVPPRAPYRAPTLRRFGAATELTQARMMTGAMDGGSNNTRTN